MTLRRVFLLYTLLAFWSTACLPRLALAEALVLPQPGTMVHLSAAFTPAHLKGIVIHPEDPFKFDFIIHRGDKALTEEAKKAEYAKLVKYFLASLAIPDEDQWVNLSPYENDRIIKEDFGKTVMGRDLLAQDYLLKQITASLIYPQDKLGKVFWDKVYKAAQEKYGTTNVPINTFNKVWILPDDALIYEKAEGATGASQVTAYVLKNHLRVMLEEDYLSLQKHSGINLATGGEVKQSSNSLHPIASNIIREIVLPALQKEVNAGANFAPLRQVYSGMLLAYWFKRTLKQSVLGRIYANKGKVKGVDQDPKINAEIYARYVQAYKKGVFNLIKEDADNLTRESVPRKYFSGGAVDFAVASRVLGHDAAMITRHISSDSAMKNAASGLDIVQVGMVNEGHAATGQTLYDQSFGAIIYEKRSSLGMSTSNLAELVYPPKPASDAQAIDAAMVASEDGGEQGEVDVNKLKQELMAVLHFRVRTLEEYRRAGGAVSPMRMLRSRERKKALEFIYDSISGWKEQSSFSEFVDEQLKGKGAALDARVGGMVHVLAKVLDANPQVTFNKLRAVADLNQEMDDELRSAPKRKYTKRKGPADQAMRSEYLTPESQFFGNQPTVVVRYNPFSTDEELQREIRAMSSLEYAAWLSEPRNALRVFRKPLEEISAREDVYGQLIIRPQWRGQEVALTDAARAAAIAQRLKVAEAMGYPQQYFDISPGKDMPWIGHAFRGYRSERDVNGLRHTGLISFIDLARDFSPENIVRFDRLLAEAFSKEGRGGYKAAAPNRRMADSIILRRGDIVLYSDDRGSVERAINIARQVFGDANIRTAQAAESEENIFNLILADRVVRALQGGRLFTINDLPEEYRTPEMLRSYGYISTREGSPDTGINSTRVTLAYGDTYVPVDDLVRDTVKSLSAEAVSKAHLKNILNYALENAYYNGGEADHHGALVLFVDRMGRGHLRIRIENESLWPLPDMLVNNGLPFTRNSPPFKVPHEQRSRVGFTGEGVNNILFSLAHLRPASNDDQSTVQWSQQRRKDRWVITFTLDIPSLYAAQAIKSSAESDMGGVERDAAMNRSAEFRAFIGRHFQGTLNDGIGIEVGHVPSDAGVDLFRLNVTIPNERSLEAGTFETQPFFSDGAYYNTKGQVGVRLKDIFFNREYPLFLRWLSMISDFPEGSILAVDNITDASSLRRMIKEIVSTPHINDVLLPYDLGVLERELQTAKESLDVVNSVLAKYQRLALAHGLRTLEDIFLGSSWGRVLTYAGFGDFRISFENGLDVTSVKVKNAAMVGEGANTKGDMARTRIPQELRDSGRRETSVVRHDSASAPAVRPVKLVIAPGFNIAAGDPLSLLSHRDKNQLLDLGISEMAVRQGLASPPRTLQKSLGFSPDPQEGGAILDQRAYIVLDFERTMREKMAEGKREINIFEIGIGGEGALETQEILAALKEAFGRQHLPSHEWTVNFTAVDFDPNVMAMFYGTFMVDMPFKLNLWGAQADTLDKRAMKDLGAKYRADYVFHRNTTYANRAAGNGNLSMHTMASMPWLDPRVYNIYLSTVNVLENLAAPGTKYILEASAVWARRALQIPGAVVFPVSAYDPRAAFDDPNDLRNIGTGIYVIQDPTALARAGIKSIIERNDKGMLAHESLGEAKEGPMTARRQGALGAGTTFQGLAEASKGAFNVLDLEPLTLSIQKLYDLKDQPGSGTQEEVQAYRNQLQAWGEQAGLRGPGVYYPFGGMDVMAPFGMVTGARDVLSVGVDDFGSVADFESFRPKRRGFLDRFREVDTKDDFWDIKQLYKTEGVGPVAVARIVWLLSGTISKICYFDFDEEGRLHFKNKQDAPSGNAMIEFTVLDKQTNQPVTKRYWYVKRNLFGGHLLPGDLKNTAVSDVVASQWRPIMSILVEEGLMSPRGVLSDRILTVGNVPEKLRALLGDREAAAFLDLVRERSRPYFRFQRFIERLSFQTFFIRGAAHLFEEYSSGGEGDVDSLYGQLEVIGNVTLRPARLRNAMAVSDNKTGPNGDMLTTGRHPHLIWNVAPSEIGPLQVPFGYSQEGGFIYFGPGKTLRSPEELTVDGKVRKGGAGDSAMIGQAAVNQRAPEDAQALDILAALPRATPAAQESAGRDLYRWQSRYAASPRHKYSLAAISSLDQRNAGLAAAMTKLFDSDYNPTGRRLRFDVRGSSNREFELRIYEDSEKLLDVNVKVGEQGVEELKIHRKEGRLPLDGFDVLRLIFLAIAEVIGDFEQAGLVLADSGMEYFEAFFGAYGLSTTQRAGQIFLAYALDERFWSTIRSVAVSHANYAEQAARPGGAAMKGPGTRVAEELNETQLNNWIRVHGHQAGYLFLGYGGASGYRSVEDMDRAAEEMARELNAKHGMGQWSLVYGGDPVDGHNIGQLIQRLKSRHPEIPVLAVQAEKYRARGILTWGFIDYVFFYPTPEVDRNAGYELYAGYDASTGALYGATRYYLGDAFISSGLKGVVAFGGGRRAGQEVEYAASRKLPVIAYKMEPGEIPRPLPANWDKYGAVDAWIRTQTVSPQIERRDVPESSGRRSSDVAMSSGRDMELPNVVISPAGAQTNVALMLPRPLSPWAQEILSKRAHVASRMITFTVDAPFDKVQADLAMLGKYSLFNSNLSRLTKGKIIGYLGGGIMALGVLHTNILQMMIGVLLVLALDDQVVYKYLAGEDDDRRKAMADYAKGFFASELNWGKIFGFFGGGLVTHGLLSTLDVHYAYGMELVAGLAVIILSTPHTLHALKNLKWDNADDEGDDAMLAVTSDPAGPRAPGGIDLDSANLTLHVKRDGAGMPLPAAQQDLAQLSNIEGLRPVILAITPASRSSLFGAAPGGTLPGSSVPGLQLDRSKKFR